MALTAIAKKKREDAEEKVRAKAVVAEKEKVLKAVERNKKKAAKTLEKANQAMKEVEAMEIQAVAIEARRKAEKEATEGKAREVIEVEMTLQ